MGLISFFQEHSVVILGLLLVISEYLGTNTNLRSNSILQLITYVLRQTTRK